MEHPPGRAGRLSAVWFDDHDSIRRLRDRYHHDLFDRFLPFVDEFVVDHREGGFLCHVDPSGRRVDERKLTWFDARGVWVYSFLHNHLGGREEHLAVARRTVGFLGRTKPATDEPWPLEVTRDGVPLVASGGAVYGDLFVAEGLAEFSKATGDDRHWHTAKELLLRSLRRYDAPDFQPAIGQTYLGPGAPPLPGARVLGIWMVLLRVATQMLQMRDDAELEGVAARCVEAIVGHHHNPRFDLLNELLEHDLSRPDNEYEQLVYTGHGVEALWMVMAEATRLGDDGLFDTAATWLRRHVEVAWDDVYGGLFRNLQHVDRNVWSTDKQLWVQEEVLIGALLVIERTGAGWAKELFERTYQYVQDTFPLHGHGSPTWRHATDRQGSHESFAALPARIENYHHPRHLMLAISCLDRMLEEAP
ncbi:AGE family epimerase/isomerase [Jiangella rhizosphaerae]|uniref:N-acylglucosamine 2-epimerase n=1 Tax=Jiangella rhizosphaerae TaxID=2293569 RepID=A0A418KM17_9ACTN|nr:AGE family epimerase/isomerase [Jiangella rhizosphaerae]RIQ18987.1 hypothetical protein DY240_20170 [Jiangella rhizosphaerae]